MHSLSFKRFSALIKKCNLCLSSFETKKKCIFSITCSNTNLSKTVFFKTGSQLVPLLSEKLKQEDQTIWLDTVSKASWPLEHDKVNSQYLHRKPICDIIFEEKVMHTLSVTIFQIFSRNVHDLELDV